MYTTTFAKNQSPFWVRIAVFFLCSTGVFFFFSLTHAATPSPVSINLDAGITKSRHVSLSIISPESARQMRISNNPNFSDASWESVKRYKDWTLSYGTGVKYVYIEFRDARGVVSQVFRDSIVSNVLKGMTVDFFIDYDPKDTATLNKETPKDTSSRTVTLYMTYSQGVEEMAISNTSNFADTTFLPIQRAISWQLTGGTGKKIVYVQFRNGNEEVRTLSKTIMYTQPGNYIAEGSILKGQEDGIYYLGHDGKIHPFIHSFVYHSWYADFGDIVRVSNAKLREYQVGVPVCIKQGTWLLTFRGQSKVYAVEPGCTLRPIRSETEAFILYGTSWKKRVVEMDLVQQSFYRTRHLTVYERKDDQDRDGVSKEMEKLYGTDDGNQDTDADGLSDYEEIFFWYSDPADPDSNDDGVTDGMSVRSGVSPLDRSLLSKVPEDTYEYPTGSLIFSHTKNRGYYYEEGDGIRYVATLPSAKIFTDSGFQDVYRAQSGFPFFLPSKTARHRAPFDVIKSPSLFKDKTLVVL